MQNSLIHILEARPEESKIIENKLIAYNKEQVPFTQDEVMYKNYIIKDKDKIIAGLNAVMYGWKILHIDILFVDNSYRGKGLGKKLLQHAENEARAMGSSLVHLDTFDFQAKDFYLQQGYEIFGILEDCPQDHKRYFLKKVI